ncbi:MAG: sensor domain CHASE-containing protein [Oceanospirillaceae bacterium]|jgi:sensor domain CHASE-containing protein
MCVPKRPTTMNRQKGWLLLAVLMIVLLVALGVVMLMSQTQLSLRSVRQEHQAIQEKVNQWPRLLNNRESVDAK